MPVIAVNTIISWLIRNVLMGTVSKITNTPSEIKVPGHICTIMSKVVQFAHACFFFLFFSMVKGYTRNNDKICGTLLLGCLWYPNCTNTGTLLLGSHDLYFLVQSAVASRTLPPLLNVITSTCRLDSVKEHKGE